MNKRLAIGLAMGLLSFSACGQDEARYTSVSEAEGLAKERGQEAEALIERVRVPDSWTKVGPSDISLTNNGDYAYAFHEDYYTLPPSTTDDVKDWWRELALVGEYREDASCEEDFDSTELSCEVWLRDYDSETGARESDGISRRVQVRFVKEDGASGVYVEAYVSG